MEKIPEIIPPFKSKPFQEAYEGAPTGNPKEMLYEYTLENSLAQAIASMCKVKKWHRYLSPKDAALANEYLDSAAHSLDEVIRESEEDKYKSHFSQREIDKVADDFFDHLKGRGGDQNPTTVPTYEDRLVLMHLAVTIYLKRAQDELWAAERATAPARQDLENERAEI